MSRVVRKVLAYVVRGGEVLVFKHTDHPEAGVQVVAGTIEGDEAPAEAVLREVLEESGLEAVVIVRFLGVQRYPMAPYRDEIQERHVFQLALSRPVPDAWPHIERHASTGEPAIRLEFSWMAIEKAAPILMAGQGELLPLVQSED